VAHHLILHVQQSTLRHVAFHLKNEGCIFDPDQKIRALAPAQVLCPPIDPEIFPTELLGILF
jgi:hypothetical protein